MTPTLQDSLSCGVESGEVKGMVIGLFRVFSVLSSVSPAYGNRAGKPL